MKQLISLLAGLFLFTACGTTTKIDTASIGKPCEVFYIENVNAKDLDKMKWSELYMTKDSVLHRYLYIENEDSTKTLILEISY